VRAALIGGRKSTQRPAPEPTKVAEHSLIGVSEELADRRRKTIPAQRFGTAAEFGALCAFVCSQHGSYITGQNLLTDGGAFGGTF
jgi:NAD(P)-dependent dehydrogenase (short-subunit alcohol dehydrogenase family)